MAKAWKDVIASPQYQSMAPDQQAEAQEQYFNEVVAPEAGEKAADAKLAFFSAYPPPQIEPFSSEQQQAQLPPQEQSILDDALLGVAEAGRGVAQAGVNVANIIPSVGDAIVSAGSWAGKLMGLGDGTYTPAMRLSLPDVLQPQTTAGKVAAQALPYLVNPTQGAARASTGIGARLTNLAAENVVGTLAENSNQANPEKLVSDLAVNAGISGAVRGVANVAGAGYRAARGQIAPEAQAAINFAEHNNAPLMTSDVIPPSTFAGRSAQAVGEKIPVTGTGAARRGQHAARSRLIDEFTEQFGPANHQEIIQSLERKTGAGGYIREAAGNRLNRISQDMQNVGAIQPTNAINAIDAEIARLERLGGVSDQQTIARLREYRGELETGAEYNLLRDLRTQFRQDVRGDRTAWPNQSEAAVNRVYRELTRDLDNAVRDNLGDVTYAKYRQANAVYAREAEQAQRTRLKNVLQKGELTPEVVNNLLFSNKPSEVRRLYNSLDNVGRANARSAIIGKAYEKAGGSPDKFLNEVNRLGNQTGIFFRGQDRRYLQGLSTYLDNTRRAGKAGAVTPTGQEVLQFGLPAGIAADVVGSGGVATMSAAGYGALTRVYESEVARNTLLRLANTPKNSTVFERNLSAVSDAFSAAVKGSDN
ncbi:Uncharacterised protein [Pragia fontium]|uniref:lytic transglycosylase domain-containing protein n=1 Tax=Pragia fontium TaxID=82985 RepID=UPI000E049EAC|nr:lytic transglycosylase domain-containing protein [Pragia fontium]SUB82031.1 Uncharacterised protein [Pragia fontium]